MKRRATTYAFLALASFGLFSGPVAGADVSPPSEYGLKAAFLFNFAKFTEWPSEAFTNTNSPIVIGVLGTNRFTSSLELVSELEGTLRDKTINNRPLQVREIQSLTEATNCHILFISTSEEKRLPQIFDTLRVAPVLTVGDELGGFTEVGGMINFVTVDKKIRFQISNDKAKNARLRISSKLLSLALRP